MAGSHNRQTLKNATFAKIKKNLASNKSYIIFEHPVKNSKASLFSDDCIIYYYLENQKLTWQQYIDKDLSREYLVIQLESENADDVLGKLLGSEFPEDAVYYVYKAEE